MATQRERFGSTSPETPRANANQLVQPLLLNDMGQGTTLMVTPSVRTADGTVIGHSCLRVVRWSRRSRGGVAHSPAGHRDRWPATREAKGRSGHHFPRLLWAPRPAPGFRASASFGADGARRALTLNDAPPPYPGGSSRTTSSALSLGSMLVALDRASTRLKISGGIRPESLVGVG